MLGSCPLIPMTAITGRLSGNKIKKYMFELHECGIESVMIYPRSGCEFEYLSDEWFECIADFIEAAKSLDMSVWLYDDFNWPSGQCKGKVTKNEKFRLKSISLSPQTPGIINTAASKCDFFELGAYPDVLSYDAVKYFIELTHEKYFERFSQYFGTTVKGIFTDEPSFLYACKDDDIAYYDEMSRDYSARFGRNLAEDIEEYVKNPSKNEFLTDCARLLGERFSDCYVKQIADWCKNHGIIMTGHLLSDDQPSLAVRASGTPLNAMCGFMLPGIDEISTNISSPWLLPLFGHSEYAARKCGRGVMAELFALGPCSMTYDEKKRMIFLSALFGVDTYFLAISHIEAHGNAHIRDYFNIWSPSQPDFGGMKEFCQKTLRAAELAHKSFKPDIYIRYPEELSARYMLDKKETEDIISAFTELVNTLSKKQTAWSYLLNTDAAEPNAAVAELVCGENGKIRFALGGEIYDNAEDLCGKIGIEPFVTDADGNEAENVFVRRYDDGTVVIVNMADKYNSVIFNKEKIELYPAQVFISDEPIRSRISANYDTLFSVSHEDINLMRAMYVNDTDKFVIEADVDAQIVLYKRQYCGSDKEVLLDGKTIVFSEKPVGMPECFENLYSMSDAIFISNGKHVLEAGDDIKYLPSVIIGGEYDMEFAAAENSEMCKLKISKRKTAARVGEKVNSFGKVCFSGDLTIPKNCSVLCVESPLYIELYIDGNMIGGDISLHKRFEIPYCLKGRSVKAVLKQFGNVGPMFGSTEYWDKTVDSCAWRNAPNVNNVPFGIMAMSFE